MKKWFVFWILLWGITLSAQTVFITKSGEKYHEERCSSLAHSSIPLSVAEARSRGYTPCKKCRPSEASTTSPSASLSLANPSTESSKTSVSPSAASVQCSGKTKKGSRCQRRTTNSNGRCYQH